MVALLKNGLVLVWPPHSKAHEHLASVASPAKVCYFGLSAILSVCETVLSGVRLAYWANHWQGHNLHEYRGMYHFKTLASKHKEKQKGTYYCQFDITLFNILPGHIYRLIDL